MEHILNYVRGLLTAGLGFSRKRRAVDECDNLVSAKVRRISSSQMSNGEDDWFSTASSHNSYRRRSGLLPKQDTIKPSAWLSSKDATPIVLDDDDDDVVEIKKPDYNFARRSFKQTSTPNSSKLQQNGASDDDIVFVKSTPSRFEAKKKGFDYVKSPLLPDTKIQNGTKRKETSPMFKMNSKSEFPISRKPSTALEHSFRLDERKRYKELLSRPQFSMKNLFDSYNDFKSFKFGTSFGFRGKKMVDMVNDKSEVRKSGRVDVIDLTAGERRKPSLAGRRSAADVIKDTLKKYDDVVVVKDGDSDVEILPTPPSPRSDFAIEKCNSLKGFVHPSEPAHNDWIGNEIKKHDEAIQKRQKLIEEQKKSLERFNSINGEIRVKLLNDKVNECLYIKDVLLPVDVAKEDAFKELTAKQNEKVDNAFRKKYPASEVLTSKFNMNITRGDLLTLSGLSWLNDEVINFYMNLIIDRGTNKNFPMAYAMNTFFYPKVLAAGQSSVRRWTRRVDLFSYDLLAVPIHLGMHWCMAMIDFRKRTITYYDSMGSPNKQCLSTLLQYLRDEHMDKKKTDIDLSDWRLSNARDIPQQMNGSDCGMFSITFAEFLTRDADVSFSQENMPYLRRKVCAEILEGKLFIS